MKKIVAGLFVAFFVALFVLFAWTRDAQTAPTRRTGHYWAGKNGDSWLIAYVTVEERGRQRALGPGRHSGSTTDYYERYRLTVRKLPDGAVAGEVQLGDVPRIQNRPEPQIVGVVDDVLWLWHGALVAHALPDLAIRYHQDSLRQAQPEKADLIPQDPKQFKVPGTPAGLLMRGRDARFYRVDPKAFALEPIPSAEMPRQSASTSPEYWFDFLLTAAQGRLMTSPYNQMSQVLLAENSTWFGLLSESESTQLAKWVQENNHPSGEVARGLYRTTYTRDDRYAIIDPATVKPVGEPRFLQGGFIRRHDGKPWQLREPDSALVLGKRRLGAAEPWEVTRLGYDGQSVWTAPTGLVQPDEFLDAGPYLLVAGRPPPDVSARPGERVGETVLWIDERTGARTSLHLATGKVE